MKKKYDITVLNVIKDTYTVEVDEDTNPVEYLLEQEEWDTYLTDTESFDPEITEVYAKEEDNES